MDKIDEEFSRVYGFRKPPKGAKRPSPTPAPKEGDPLERGQLAKEILFELIRNPPIGVHSYEMPEKAVAFADALLRALNGEDE